MKISMLTKMTAVFLTALLLLGASGCGTEWESLALEILEEWANEHNINPSSPGGAVNLARRAASGSTGDEEADAAIGYDDVVEQVQKEEESGTQEADTGDKGKEGEEQPDVIVPVPEGQSTVSADPAGHVENFLSDDVAPEDRQPPRDAGVTWEQMVDELIPNVKSPSGVSSDSMEQVFERVQGLVYEQNPETGRYEKTRSSGHDTVELELSNGDKVQVGILVAPDGSIKYTSNGKDYVSDLDQLINPSLTQQASDLYRGVKDQAWSALFEGSTGNPDTDLQNQVAAEVMEDLRNQLNAGETPKSVGEWTEGQLWDNYVKDPLQSGVREMMWSQAESALNEYIESAVLETEEEQFDMLETFRELKGEFDGGKTTTPKAWDKFKEEYGLDLFELSGAHATAVSGAEFAVESIKTMGRSLQDTDFAVRSRAYIQEREAGHDPQLIWENMRNGQLPELDIGSGKNVSGGVSSMLASSNVESQAQMGVLFTMYEQAYQRYQIAKGLRK